MTKSEGQGFEEAIFVTSKTDELHKLVKRFADKYEAKYGGLQALSETSLDESDKKKIYAGRDIFVIHMDDVADDAYFKARKPNADKNERIKSVDACFVSEDNEWFLIEFKNQKVKSAKRDCLQKTYENWYMIMDIFHEMREEVLYTAYDYSDPYQFARDHVFFYLVCSTEKNPNKAKDIINRQRASCPKSPDDEVKRIEGYLFKKARCILDYELEKEILERGLV